MAVLLPTSQSLNPFVLTLQPVWENPTRVFLDQAKLLNMARSIGPESFPTPTWRESVFPVDDEIFVDFIGVGNAINFAFTDLETQESFRVEWQGREWRGAFAMWASLSRGLESGLNLLDARLLRELSAEQCQDIFRGASRIPMLEERLNILREVGTVLSESYGSFHNLFCEARYKAFGPGGVVQRVLDAFPSYRDQSSHAGTGALLKFQKRAQLLAMMYQGRALDSMKLPRLSDSGRVGPIADYTVPKTLHAFVVLRFSPELEMALKTWSPIERGSMEEVEIRAQTVHAQIELRDRISEVKDENVDFLALDYKLWTIGRNLNGPHHLTKTTAY